MTWTVIFLDDDVESEMESQPEDIQARFKRMVVLVGEFGLQRLPPKYVRHLARALYVTASGQRVVVVRVFTKKTQRTPRKEIELALKRAEEVA